MIDHVSVAVRDLAAAMRFYDAVLAALGYQRLDTRTATAGYGKKYSDFWINLRAAGAAMSDGAHVCFRAGGTEIVDAFHAAALRSGGASDGEPGLRPLHGEGYYAAFIRDPDGNRIEAVTFVRK
ncbi:MAG: VOC family protein [Pseudolabrys sp.]|jgi:catechol 2,3-dioxygenase-like lactoylglutathione lyase family enzyme